MADNLAISIVSSCEFKPKMPPGYEGEHSESEDSISPPASPTTDITDSPQNGQNGNQSETEDDTDGGGEHDEGREKPRAERGDVIMNGIFNDGKENLQLVLPVDDVVTDGAGEKNSHPLELKKCVVEKGVQERKSGVKKNATDDGAQGDKSDKQLKGTPPVKSTGHLNQNKEKTPITKSQDVSDENIHEFIDNIEEAMVAMSKGEEGASDRLVAIVKIFLPLMLCIVSEVTTLRGKVKDFILEKRSFQKEVRQLKREIEERDAKDVDNASKQTGSVIPVSSSVEPLPDVKGSADDGITNEPRQKQASVEDESTKKELKKLRSQNKELQRVNHSWEKYCKKLSVKHEIDLKKKTAQLAASDERRKELERRLEEKFKDYDQTLLHARHSESQHRAAAEQYKKDRDDLRKKYEEMKTHLREWIEEREDKDKEIQRLNQVVERQAAQKPNTKMRVDEQMGCAGHPKQTKKGATEMVNGGGPMFYINLSDDLGQITIKEKHPRDSTTRPRSPRSPTQSPPRSPPAKGNPMTLAKDELKDQVELYRQQIDVFRSDFIQERRDREKAVGQVDSLKKELEKTKKKLEEMQKDRYEHDVFGLGQEYMPRRPREDTQKKVRGGRNTGYGRQYAFQHFVDLPDNHVYSVIED